MNLNINVTMSSLDVHSPGFEIRLSESPKSSTNCLKLEGKLLPEENRAATSSAAAIALHSFGGCNFSSSSFQTEQATRQSPFSSGQLPVLPVLRALPGQINCTIKKGFGSGAGSYIQGQMYLIKVKIKS